jgi:hypothetical protein
MLQLVSELVRGLLRFSRRELLVWEVGSWGRGQVGKLEEAGRLPLEAATEQRQCTLVCVCSSEL